MESPPAVSVVLPTYNEADSLPVVIPAIAKVLREAGLGFEVLVVDDASPDGTADVAEALPPELCVRTLRRKERGLATAVLRGFEAATGMVCVVMDADGSHPATSLPEMVRLIEQDKADIVVGSRHVAGGGSRNWPLVSQLKSQLASLPTLGLTSMTDPTTGFMAIRRSLAERLSLDPVGWKIVLETVVKAHPCRLAEVPIVFEDRSRGQSKQSLAVAAQYALHLLKLYAFRFPGLAELAKFCLVGVSGLFVDLLTVFALKELFALDTRLCAVGGFATAVTTNYLLNRAWTFRRAAELPWLWSYLTYVAANMFGLAVRMAAIHLLIVLAGLDQGYQYLWTNAAGIGLATLVNFVGAKYFAFDPARLSWQAQSQPPPGPAPHAARPARWARPLAVAVLGGALALYAVEATVLRELTTSDEAVNVTMARNMQNGFEHVVRPSVVPGGHTDWLAEDLPALGNLPFYPALLALAGMLGGLPAMGALSWLSLLASIAFTYRLLALQDRRAALYAALLLVASPAFVRQSLLLEFEPLLCALCAGGLYFFVDGTRTRRRARCFVGGLLFGLGFLVKMWLIVPYAFALCTFVLVQATVVRERECEPLSLRRALFAAAAGFTCTASAHLLFVAATAPADLPHWLSTVYLGIFSGEGVSGSKLSGLPPGSGGARAPWYYPAVLFRAHFMVLPLCLFGVSALLRRNRAHALSMLAIAFGAALALVPLSVPAFKEPLYVLSVAPPLYALAATCLSELEGDAETHVPANRALIALSLGVAAVSALSVAASALAGAIAIDYAALHVLGMGGCAVVGHALYRRRSALPPLLLLSVAGAGIALGLAMAS